MSLRSDLDKQRVTPSLHELLKFFAQGMSSFADASLRTALDLALDGTNVSDQELWLVVAKAAASLAGGSIAPGLSGSTLALNADGLTEAGIIVPQHLEIIAPYVPAANSQITRNWFLANRAYQVVAITEIHDVAEATAGSLNIQVTKDTGTTAPGGGTALLTNNSNAGFDGKATARTVQVGTLSVTTADLQLAVGDRLSVKFSASATELSETVVAISLKRI